MSNLYIECELLFASGGYQAVKRYIDFIEKRPILGINMDLVVQAEKDRKKLLDHFKKIKK